MPWHNRKSPAFRTRFSRFLRFALPCAASLWLLPAQAEQLWSVHAYGIKVGELRASFQETATTYAGQGSFRTTGLAGVLRRIQFTITGNGSLNGSRPIPAIYSGSIYTGRRQAVTELDFSASVPRQISGADKPAVPIESNKLVGAIDPVTMMWLIIDVPFNMPCSVSQRQFDGTRLTSITLNKASREGDRITCEGTYERLGGYTEAELAEITSSPLVVVYDLKDGTWRASEITFESRHGTAFLRRRDEG